MKYVKILTTVLLTGSLFLLASTVSAAAGKSFIHQGLEKKAQ